MVDELLEAVAVIIVLGSFAGMVLGNLLFLMLLDEWDFVMAVRRASAQLETLGVFFDVWQNG